MASTLHGSRTNIFIACFPKPGSTYVSALLAEITNFTQLSAVQFYGHNEQDLFEPALKKFRQMSSVTQQHVKGTNNNVRLMKEYNIRPVILVRNICDVVLSLHDHFAREDILTPVGYVHREYQEMSFEQRLWFLIHIHLPWYFNFFVSWREASKELDVLWMSYEQFFADRIVATRQILEFYDLTVSDEEIRDGVAKVAKKNTRFNIGTVGRGATLPNEHREAIQNLARVWRINLADLRIIGLDSGCQAQNQQGPAHGYLREQSFVSRTVVPTKRDAIRVDLGCGSVKQAGFVGIDRYALPGVDIVADLDRPLPLRENSVDLLYASHSLEHVANLVALIREIYRVCRHGAQVCIVAPYSQQGLNLANPYHKQIFNEHTPRFWTTAQTTMVPAEEFAHPHAPRWGLAESDNSSPGVDLRCLKMEFFYFPEYRCLSSAEQREARKKYFDVCDQIMYHLLVVKEPVSEVGMQQLAENIEYYEPPYVTIRKLREQQARQEQTIQELRQALAAREAELREAEAGRNAQEALLEQTRGSLHAREREVEGLRTALGEMRTHFAERVVELEAKAEAMRQELVAREGELAQTQAALAEAQGHVVAREQAAEELRQALAAREAELRETEAALQAREAVLEQTRLRLQAQEREVEELRVSLARARIHFAAREAGVEEMKGHLDAARRQLARFERSKQLVAAELESFRRRRVTRWLARLKPGGDLRNEVAPAFQQLKDDSLLFTPNLKGFRLQPSKNLQHVPFLEYPLELRRPYLSGILLAPILDFPISKGVLGVELVSPANTIILQSVLPCAEIDEHLPTCFQFSPVADSQRGQLRLRVFVREVDGPVRVFEWRKYGLGGLGGLHTRAFCGFLFQD